MLSQISMNKDYEFKKNDYPFIYYFNNEQIEWNPKKDVADIIKETYNEKDIKVSKHKGTVILESRKKLLISTDIRLLEHLRSDTEGPPHIAVPKFTIPHPSFE